MTRFIRLYDYSKEAKPIELCEHIQIKGRELQSDDGCEYIEELKINCLQCNKIIEVNVLVN